MLCSHGAEGAAYRYTRATFLALAEAIIPRMCGSMEDAVPGGTVGAAQLGVDRFVMAELDLSQFVPVDAVPGSLPALSCSTARLLDTGAEQLIRIGLATLHTPAFPGGGVFASLACRDRLQALALLDRLEVPVHLLPPPYRNNSGLVQTMINSLISIPCSASFRNGMGWA